MYFFLNWKVLVSLLSPFFFFFFFGGGGRVGGEVRGGLETSLDFFCLAGSLSLSLSSFLSHFELFFTELI